MWMKRGLDWIRVGVVIATVAGAAPFAARAQQCGAGERGAMQLTNQARDEYRAARYSRAIELLEEALALCPQPVIVFNLGRAHHEDGNLQAARDDFRRYLAMRPDAPDREEVERRLASIERALDEEAALAQRAEDSNARAARAREDALSARRASAETARRTQVGPWILGASGVLILGVATGLGVAAMLEADVGPEVDNLEASRADGRAQAFALSANIGFAVGGAALLAGLIWGIVVLTGAPSDTALAVRGGRNGATLELRF